MEQYIYYKQEGRLGIRTICRKTLLYSIIGANAAASYTNYLEYVIIDGIKIAIDKRILNNIYITIC